MARIVIIGPEGRQEVALQAHNSLGRHPNNTIQVLDRIVSKEHIHINLVGNDYVLKDLGSLNGTYVNGERISERVLADQDEITLGATRIIFQGEAPRVPTATDSGSTGTSRVTMTPGMVESHIRTKL